MCPGLTDVIASAPDKHNKLIQFKSVNSYLESVICWGLLGRDGGHLTFFKTTARFSVL